MAAPPEEGFFVSRRIECYELAMQRVIYAIDRRGAIRLAAHRVLPINSH